MLEPVVNITKSVEHYRPIVGEETIEELKALAVPLRGVLTKCARESTMQALELIQVYPPAHSRTANVCGCLGQELGYFVYVSVKASSPHCVVVIAPLYFCRAA